MIATVSADGSIPASARRSVYLIDTYWADSIGRRNALFVDLREPSVKCLGRRSPVQRLARSAIECCGNGSKGIGAMCAEIGAFGKVLAQQPIGILVGAALPRTLRVAEVDLHAGVDFQARILRHLRALIPGARPSQLLRQGGDCARNGIPHRLGSVSGQRPSVLDYRTSPATFHARQVQ